MHNADELDMYARKIFGLPSLSHFMLLIQQEERVRSIAEVLKDRHDQKKPIPKPVPKEVICYIGKNNQMGRELLLAVLPSGESQARKEEKEEVVKKSERVQLIIRTAGVGEFGYQAIPCGKYQQVVLRFPNGDAVVFTGEGFSSDKYEEKYGEVERLQDPPALEQPKENSSDELMKYAKEAGLFGKADLSRIQLLDQSEKVRVIGEEILWCEHGQSIPCPRPIPEELFAYIEKQGERYKECC